MQFTPEDLSVPPLSHELSGCQVWVTRPEAQAAGTAEVISLHGGKPFIYPTLVIEPRPVEAAALANTSQIIVTSQNAIRMLDTTLRTALENTQARFLAVGHTSAVAVKALGKSVDFVPTTVGSEALLAQAPSLQSIAGQHIVILTGADGRTLLPDTLHERGAQVQMLETYRRAAPQPLEDMSEVSQSHAIIIPSLAAYENAHTLLEPAQQAWFYACCAVCVSPRIQSHIESCYPQQKTILADSPHDADVIAALIQWWAASPNKEIS